MRMSVLRQLKNRYVQAGFRVYSKYFSELSAAPSDWRGGAADLIVDRGGRRTALFLVTEEHLAEGSSGRGWRQAKRNPRTQLKLLVTRESLLPRVQSLLDEKDIQAKVALIRRTSRSPQTKAKRRRTVIVSIFVFLLTTAVALSYWSAEIWNADAPEHYEPRDLQRQKAVEEKREA